MKQHFHVARNSIWNLSENKLERVIFIGKNWKIYYVAYKERRLSKKEEGDNDDTCESFVNIEAEKHRKNRDCVV
ncbi:MAG: hypothetical protein K2L07_04505 [Lachnospiraceae bacterium]|nr:hypothetical protein [Lachnospiraceae bacterium]